MSWVGLVVQLIDNQWARALWKVERDLHFVGVRVV